MSVPETFAIRTRALCKFYGERAALDHLDLAVPREQIHAIVGANGAGKSTLFRILLGFLPASSGQAQVLGVDSAALTPADRGRIGFVNEEHSLPGWMEVGRLSRMQERLYPRWNPRVYEQVLGHFHVQSQQRVAQLSRGERAGLNLALALAQSPELLILDEPTLGLDVVAKRAFLEALLYSRGQDCHTVVYCSHQMEEVERVADQLVILEHGQLKHASSPDAFCERVRLWISDIPFKGPPPQSVPGLLQAQRIDGLHHYLVLDQDDDFADFLRAQGARSVQHMAVSLDRAVNAFLSKHHAAPTDLYA